MYLLVHTFSLCYLLNEANLEYNRLIITMLYLHERPKTAKTIIPSR